MSIRNYNAFLKAARKAASKTGGLSLPAARKAYKKMSARVGRPLKGIDVKKHPRIFKESIPVKSGGRNAKRFTGLSKIRKQTGAASRGSNKGGSEGRGSGGSVKRKTVGGVQGKPQPATRGVSTARRAGPTKERAEGSQGMVVTEYVSTPEYTKRGAKGGFRLQLQIHITGPAGQTKKRLDEIASDWLRGRNVPAGFEVGAFEWNGKKAKTSMERRVARSHFSGIPFTF